MVIINAAPNMKTTYNLGNMEQIPLGEGRLFQPGNLPVAVFRAARRVLRDAGVVPPSGGPPGRQSHRRRRPGLSAAQFQVRPEYRRSGGQRLWIVADFPRIG